MMESKMQKEGKEKGTGKMIISPGRTGFNKERLEKINAKDSKARE